MNYNVSDETGHRTRQNDQFDGNTPTELTGVGEAAVGEYGLRYHAGEGKHSQTAVGDLLELHVRLAIKSTQASQGAGGQGKRG